MGNHRLYADLGPLSRQLIASEITNQSRVIAQFKEGGLVSESKAAKK